MATKKKFTIAEITQLIRDYNGAFNLKLVLDDDGLVRITKASIAEFIRNILERMTSHAI